MCDCYAEKKGGDRGRCVIVMLRRKGEMCDCYAQKKGGDRGRCVIVMLRRKGEIGGDV